MRKVTIGLIGCGWQGRVHAECLAEINDAHLKAYADVNEEIAKSCLKDCGGDYTTTDARKIISDDSIDAVYICTRHDSHAPLAIAAAEAGKHILLEKPIALALEDCERVAEAVDKHGVIMMPAFKMRYYPCIVKAREFIPKPHVIVGQVMDNRWPDDLWAQDPILGGGNVQSQGCHTTDILRFFADSEPKKIWATGGALTHPGHECIDQCVASIQFENGVVASWIQGDACQTEFTSKFFFEMFGEGRSVAIYDRLKKATFRDGENSWTEERPEEEGYQLENEAFIKALQENRQPELTALDGIQATRMVLAADKAIRTGDVQEF